MFFICFLYPAHLCSFYCWEEFSKAVREGEDCEEMASCGPGKGMDKELLNMCLTEKEKLKKINEIIFLIGERI